MCLESGWCSSLNIEADVLGELLPEATGRALHLTQDSSRKLFPTALWSVSSRELGTNAGAEIRARPCTSRYWGGEGVFDVTVIPYPSYCSI